MDKIVLAPPDKNVLYNNTSINIKFNMYKNSLTWVAMSNLNTHQFDSHNLIFLGYRDFLARYGRNLCNGHK